MTLRIFHRVINSTSPSDYFMYLQESDYNIGVKYDSEIFSQTISYKKFKLWYMS